MKRIVDLDRLIEHQACKENDIWIMVKAYSISIYEVMRRLPDIESKLIAAWNALATDGTK